MMKEQFEDLQLDIIYLEGDVITTSGCNQGGDNELEQDIFD